MAKTEKDAAAPEERPTTWEVTRFLKDPKGASACVKGVGPSTVLDDIDAVVEAFYAKGYQPDHPRGNGNGNGAAAGSQPSAGADKKPCPIHPGNFLYKKDGKFGVFFSHKNPDGDGYCKGR